MRAGYEEVRHMRAAKPSQLSSPLEWFAMKRRIKSRIDYNRSSSMFCGSLYSSAVNDAIRVLQLARHIAEDEAFVVFRGTKVTSLHNLLSGATSKLAPCEGGGANAGRAHSGFQNAYLRIRDRLHAALDAQKGKKVVFMGHSRGGSIALLAARDYAGRVRHDARPGLVTFGAPKTCDWAACQDARERVRYHLRVAHRGDPIARLTPSNEYAHAADKWEDAAEDAAPRPAWSALEGPPGGLLAQHSMRSYIASILGACGIAGVDAGDVHHDYAADTLGWSKWVDASPARERRPQSRRLTRRRRSRSRRSGSSSARRRQ